MVKRLPTMWEYPPAKRCLNAHGIPFGWGIDGVAYLLGGYCSGFYVELVLNSVFVDKIFENKLCHGRTADVTMTREEYPDLFHP